MVTYSSRCPQGGETMQGIQFEEHLGGKGLNEAIASSRLSIHKGHVRMWGNVGDDEHGKKMLAALHDAKVNTELVSVLKDVSSGSATIIVETDSGENRIIIIPGANGELDPTEEQLAANFKDADSSDYVVVQNEFPGVRKVIEWLHANKPQITIVYNPSPVKADLLDVEMLQKVDILVVNEGEAQQIVNSDSSDDKLLLASLHKLLPKTTVIITLGGRGCILQKEETVEQVSGVKVEKVVDTTGAGDTFLGGVVSQLYFGADLVTAVQFATAAASEVIQKKGAVESIPEYSRHALKI
ncbi:hypothetical protein OGAPHI_006660 [Ogataea philodendri]|uniref:Ribokinase n=1 Tax=Ogataea philodendri TaxID=1378263 RepID=A0A9P8NVW6_9ASCO|nr:uncharacterized protein OGAPHI_006660 [Ogataea philodendri]KAH3661253.1 hypothetical protein OGAPHI_006660 [Ogataea philodendri]